MKTQSLRARVTQTEIASRSGYHPSTVSLALRRHPSIPAATQEKILRLAKEMGYRPDPALSSLIAYRSSRRSSNSQGTAIAVISDHDDGPSAWRDIHPTYKEYWKGMREQADHLGYSLYEFSVGNNRGQARRINEILEARGITAVIVAPLWNNAEPLPLNWDRLSAVSLGYSLSSPSLPRVTHAHHFGAMLAVERLHALGYRRPALVIPRLYDERVHFGWSAGFLAGCHIHQKSMTPLLYTPEDTGSLLNSPLRLWIEDQQPDCVITAHFQVIHYLRALGFRIPEEIGYVFLDCEPAKPEISGIIQNSRQIGQHAVSAVSSAFINFRRGIPDQEESHLINGIWQQGKTVRCASHADAQPAHSPATEVQLAS